MTIFISFLLAIIAIIAISFYKENIYQFLVNNIFLCIMAIFTVGALSIIIFWNLNHDHEKIRNIILILGVLGGAIGILMANERQNTFSAQVKTQIDQIKQLTKQVSTQEKQAEISRNQFFSETLARAFELLADDKNANMRSNGIRVLKDLEKNSSKDQRDLIVGVIYNFIVDSSQIEYQQHENGEYKTDENNNKIPTPLGKSRDRIDIEVALQALFEISKHKQYNSILPHSNFSNLDLRGVSFSLSKKISGANFSNSLFSGFDFSNISLNDCSFEGAKMESVNFSSANLINCNFSKTFTSGLSFGNAVVSNCRFIGSTLIASGFTGASIENSAFSGCKMQDGGFYQVKKLEKCNFMNTKFISISFAESEVLNCNFSDSTLDVWITKDAKFINVNFCRAKIMSENQGHKLPCVRTVFIECNFSNATFFDIEMLECSFENCNFESASLLGMDISGNKFSKTEFSGNQMNQIIFSQIKPPLFASANTAINPNRAYVGIDNRFINSSEDYSGMVARLWIRTESAAIDLTNQINFRVDNKTKQEDQVFLSRNPTKDQQMLNFLRRVYDQKWSIIKPLADKFTNEYSSLVKDQVNKEIGSSGDAKNYKPDVKGYKFPQIATAAAAIVGIFEEFSKNNNNTPK